MDSKGQGVTQAWGQSWYQAGAEPAPRLAPGQLYSLETKPLTQKDQVCPQSQDSDSQLGWG